MKGDRAFSFEVDGDGDVVVRIPAGTLDPERVLRFLDCLVLEEIREKSALSEAEAAGIAAEVDAAVWDRVRTRYQV